MKKLFIRFLICFLLCTSFFLPACGEEKTPAPDGDNNGSDTEKEWPPLEYQSGYPLVPVTPRDPDEERNPYPVARPPYDYHPVGYRTLEEVKQFIRETPEDFMSGYYWRFLHDIRKEGFFLEPHYDGRSAFEDTPFYFGLIYEGGESRANNNWGYGCRFQMDGGGYFDVEIYYLMHRKQMEDARESPCLYEGGKKNAGPITDEQRLKDHEREVLLIEGRETVTHIFDHKNGVWSQVMYFLCQAGYIVEITTYEDSPADIMEIAQKLSFVKVPLED